MKEATAARRPYRMSARADATVATGERILDSFADLFWQRSSDQISLDEVAAAAGVSVQTVIRRFGGKQGLFLAALKRQGERVRAQRDEAPVGDVIGAVKVLVDHYEDFGDRVLKLLADEERTPAVRAVTDPGRAMHAEWCERVFAPTLAALRGAQRARRFAQLVAVCDVYTWKLMRRDRGLSRRQTELALVELLQPLTEAH